ncbi:hypothetical protein V565_142640 [Rhizoctonia solani 123E]|uniref:Uncharacterized protein n=1 Tax=Rhizoctonia solani 123E TaxID=1423351 RepID=A0A074SCT1_9AGAM|nr:hypothetical protein V565_142640 [Rhizoctonia solani 123E]
MRDGDRARRASMSCSGVRCAFRPRELCRTATCNGWELGTLASRRAARSQTWLSKRCTGRRHECASREAEGVDLSPPSMESAAVRWIRANRWANPMDPDPLCPSRSVTGRYQISAAYVKRGTAMLT